MLARWIIAELFPDAYENDWSHLQADFDSLCSPGLTASTQTFAELSQSSRKNKPILCFLVET